MEELKILVVYRRSTYTEMMDGKERGHITELIKRKDPVLERILKAHENHEASMGKIRAELERRRIDATWRYDFSGILPDNYDLVITIGGDGTVLHASHSIDTTPVLPINSSPDTSTGYFAAGDADDFPQIMQQIIDKTMSVRKLYRMEVQINGELVNSRVLNDILFSNSCPASTTRYQLGCCANVEDQISSGVWLSTAAGSTAAVRGAGGTQMPLESEKLQFLVREPCAGGGRTNPALPELVNRVVSEGDKFYIRSRTDDASLFIDGPHVVIPVNFGDIITVSGGKSPICLFGNFPQNKT